MANDMLLEVWQSDFLLPSVDCRSLQFMACAKICAAPVKIIKDSSPWNSPTGTLPVFRQDTNTTYCDFESFTNHLRKQIPEITLDGHLSQSQLMELCAFEALLAQKLLPAYLYTMWVDTPNFNTITNKWYCGYLRFGYGIYYCEKQRREATDFLRQLYPGEHVGTEDIEFQVTKDALQCINMLSVKLGEQKYFFGDRPSTLDAQMFGYLATLLKTPFPNDRIQTHIRGCKNLCRFVDSIINVYLPLSSEESQQQRKSLEIWEKKKLMAQAEMRPPKLNSDLDTENYPLRDKIVFGVGAVVLSILFAVHFGIVRVEVKELD